MGIPEGEVRDRKGQKAYSRNNGGNAHKPGEINGHWDPGIPVIQDIMNQRVYTETYCNNIVKSLRQRESWKLQEKGNLSYIGKHPKITADFLAETLQYRGSAVIE